MAGPIRQNVLIGLACSLLAVASLWSIRQEMVIRNSEAGVADATNAPSAQPFPVVRAAPLAAPARAVLLDALRNAMLVAADPQRPDRDILLADARNGLASIAHVRPHWAEMWIVKAFVYSLSSPGFTATERVALIQSYLDAPYLHISGRWRVQRAMAHWNDLPRFVQDRVAKETVWLYITSSGRDPAALLRAARESDAYVPVFRELRRTMQ